MRRTTSGYPAETGAAALAGIEAGDLDLVFAI
jgi:hypothetical protein